MNVYERIRMYTKHTDIDKDTDNDKDNNRTRA